MIIVISSLKKYSRKNLYVNEREIKVMKEFLREAPLAHFQQKSHLINKYINKSNDIKQI